MPTKLNLYKDGKFLSDFGFSTDNQKMYTYWFEVRIEEAGCYILEIPQQMISSSFCFRKEGEAETGLVPGRVFEVSSITRSDVPDNSAGFMPLNYINTKTTINIDPNKLVAYKICSESSGLLYTPSGLVGDCISPSVIAARRFDEDKYLSSLLFELDWKCFSEPEEAPKDIKSACGKHYLIKIEPSDYVVYKLKTHPMVNGTVTTEVINSVVNSGQRFDGQFGICQPSTIVLNEKGSVASCKSTPFGLSNSGGGFFAFLDNRTPLDSRYDHFLAIKR